MSCLLPGDSPNEIDLLQLAERASPTEQTPYGLAWKAWYRGLAEYRLGRYAEAARWLEKCLAQAMGKFPFAQAPARFVLAMTQHQRGQNDEARATLARLREAAAMREEEQDEETEALRCEVEALLNRTDG